MTGECCNELTCPNTNKPDGGKEDWDRDYSELLPCLVHGWIYVCWACTDGFAHKKLRVWDEAARCYTPTELGAEYQKLYEGIKDAWGMDGHDLYERLKGTPVGRRKINELRDLLEDALRDYFKDKSYCIEDEWYSRRLDTDLEGQMKLPLGEEQEEGNES